MYFLKMTVVKYDVVKFKNQTLPTLGGTLGAITHPPPQALGPLLLPVCPGAVEVCSLVL